jgi:predicted nucleotidyltransferase
MNMSAVAVPIDDEAIAGFCTKYGVAKLSLFGSVLRSDFDPARSDVDVLVEFLPGEQKSLFKLMEMEQRLAELFGRKVDLVTPGGLSKYFRDDVMASARVLYDSA